MDTKRIGIIGAGTWGMALARSLCLCGHSVIVWSALPEEIDQLNQTRRQVNLPYMAIPDEIVFTKDAAEACTDKDIIVGCTYVYDGNPEQYYEKMTDISIASLSEERSPLWYCSFPSKTSHNQIESYFYTAEADVPADYVHLSVFEINGQTVYYVITEIVPGIVITMPAA